MRKFPRKIEDRQTLFNWVWHTVVNRRKLVYTGSGEGHPESHESLNRKVGVESDSIFPSGEMDEGSLKWFVDQLEDVITDWGNTSLQSKRLRLLTLAEDCCLEVPTSGVLPIRRAVA